MPRTPTHLAATVATAAALALLPAANASASSPTRYPGCPEKALCVWSGENFTGEVRILDWMRSPSCMNMEFPVKSLANTYPNVIGIMLVMGAHAGRDCTGEDVGGASRAKSAPTLSAPGLSIRILT